MRESLKQKIHRLIRAINEALAESGEISDSLGGVSDEGYDPILILEATVVLNQRGDRVDLEPVDFEEEDEPEDECLLEEAAEPDPFQGLCTEVSDSDREFLHSLRIRIEG